MEVKVVVEKLNVVFDSVQGMYGVVNYIKPILFLSLLGVLVPQPRIINEFSVCVGVRRDVDKPNG